jgi:hypothetical protein
VIPVARQPTDQFRAGHIPAALLPPGTDPHHVTVIVLAPVEHRLSVSPVALLTVACTFAGLAALAFLLTQLVYAAVPFAGISAGGITFALRRKS